MGLAGRKQKQRIPNDPRNLSWADDAARFGQSYMSKLGWDPSKGLGASGEGMKSHLKVSQKLDMLGIGAAHQQDPHGIAWKQNKDFEALLQRLNAQDEQGRAQGSTSTLALGEFVRPHQHELEAHTNEEKFEEDGVSNQLSKKEKKRRRKDGEDDREKKERKKHKKEKPQDDVTNGLTAVDSLNHSALHVDPLVLSLSSSPDTASSTPQTRPKGRPMAHRARIQAAKRLANKSAAEISEVLGIAPTPSPISSITPSGSLTPITSADGDLPLEKLTISNKCVGDYFKEKLAAKTGSNTPATNNDVGASRGGKDTSTPSHNDDNDDQPRVGLGAGRKYEAEEDSNRPRAGIGGSSNAFAQFFSASSSSHATVIQMAYSATQNIVQSPATVTTTCDDSVGEEKTTDKQLRKEKKREEKRRQRAQEGSATPETVNKISEGDAEAERKKRKERKSKMKSEPVSTPAVEEPKGGRESDTKKKKKAKLIARTDHS